MKRNNYILLFAVALVFALYLWNKNAPNDGFATNNIVSQFATLFALILLFFIVFLILSFFFMIWNSYTSISSAWGVN